MRALLAAGVIAPSEFFQELARHRREVPTSVLRQQLERLIPREDAHVG